MTWSKRTRSRRSLRFPLRAHLLSCRSTNLAVGHSLSRRCSASRPSAGHSLILTFSQWHVILSYLTSGHRDFGVMSTMNQRKRRRQDGDEISESSPRRAPFSTDENHDSHRKSLLLASVKEAFRKKAEVSTTTLSIGTLQLITHL